MDALCRSFFLLSLLLASVVLAQNVPSPIVFPPSQYWDGSDGSWSSFSIRVGSPEQYLRVMPSTAGSATWVILTTGCDTNLRSSCAESRGALFNPNESTTWSDRGFFGLELNTNLNYSGSGSYGLETVGVGLADGPGMPLLEKQVVAGIIIEQYHLGVFGLNPQPTNFTTFNDPQPSFLTSLRGQNLIPSLSWGYTAGAPYRLKRVLGSLTLGGYDNSRLREPTQNFTFAPDISRDLVVGLQSITSSPDGGSSTTLLSSGILTYIDSTVPYIYLPIEACREFETAFNLTWDETSSLYLISDAARARLVEEKPSFTFRLGNTAQGGDTLDIVLPYDAFDLEATYPLVQNRSRYFPLRRAENETQYTLGRAFLQEAYLIADYERSTFSLSQAQFPTSDAAPLTQDIRPILSPTLANTTTPTSPPKPISKAVIAGSTVGGLAFLIALLALALYLLRRRRQQKQQAAREKASSAASDLAGSSPSSDTLPQDPNHKHELLGCESGAELPTPPEKYEVDGTDPPQLKDIHGGRSMSRSPLGVSSSSGEVMEVHGSHVVEMHGEGTAAHELMSAEEEGGEGRVEGQRYYELEAGVPERDEKGVRRERVRFSWM
ncbi:MAG: hypothetical protein M1817_000311 [Caeruleum heppii]|nr:MAG: hypothetical protein M1817_000311 [Caeruleum heppii]